MSKSFRTLAHVSCALGIAINTILFGTSLFNDLHQMAVFNLLCAGGCWIGYYKFGDNTDGDE